MNLENTSSKKTFSDNASLKENLENYFIKNDDVILKSISWIIAQSDSITQRFESELAFELPFLDYRVAKKCHSLILDNPNIQKQYNLERINEVIEDWLSICEVVNESFKKNHPKKFQSSNRIVFGKTGMNTLEELKKRRGLESQKEEKFTDEYYESLKKSLINTYHYSKKQAGIMVQQSKRRNYVSYELANKKSVEEIFQYIDKYIDSKEREKIRETFFKIMQKYKLFDSNVIKTRRFNCKKVLCCCLKIWQIFQNCICDKYIENPPCVTFI